MAHCVVAAAEAILDREFPVLDKGFVRLVDYLGGDQRIVQAARVSYGEGTKTFREDRGLISYLLRNEHTSPFEQVVLTFHVKMPIFVARQWIRHRTARVNEISGRYSVLKDDFYEPDSGDIAFQSEDNKQGRSEAEVPQGVKDEVLSLLKEDRIRLYSSYTRMIELGIARELARINLPLSIYTEWYWQMDLHNLFRFLKLRLDAHAQKEIRAYASAILGITEAVCPMATEAFREHVLGGVQFSSNEVEALKALLSGRDSGLTGRERERFEAKLGPLIPPAGSSS